jgi:hypothetical protein
MARTKTQATADARALELAVLLHDPVTPQEYARARKHDWQIWLEEGHASTLTPQHDRPPMLAEMFDGDTVPKALKVLERQSPELAASCLDAHRSARATRRP